MTAAAKELHMTQSGVSQHVKALEEMLGVKLFDRIKQRLVPTSQGAALYRHCSRGLQEIEHALVQIKGQGNELLGQVALGMPIEFGNNLLLPLVGKFSQKHPLVSYRFRLGIASYINDLLLNGTLDFALIDDLSPDRRIETEKVYDEVLDLCVASDRLKQVGQPRHQRAFYEELDYIDYQEEEPVLRMWFAHHLDARNIHLKVKATVMDTQSVARLICAGVGAGVLPSHLATKLEKEGQKIHRFKGSGLPLKNAISLAYLRDRTQSPAASGLMDWIRGAFKVPGGGVVKSGPGV